jgi:aryl-alcohol dehydrogenase-like predicted oxidoreductase
MNQIGPLQHRSLGRSGLSVPALGVGTNKWGTAGKSEDQLFDTFRTALDAGTNLIDTAEIYAGGRSEQMLGQVLRRDPRPVTVITKFAPYPTRLSARTMLTALKASLARMRRPVADVYLVHFPFTFLSIRSMMDAMAELHKSGLIRAIGVSNFNAQRMRAAADRLDRHGLCLAANEVHYSLLHRSPETNGVLAACEALDVALIAYYPLSTGLLTKPGGGPPQRLNFLQRRLFGKGADDKLDNLRRTLHRVAEAHGATVGQVALSWLLNRSSKVIAIPGATSAGHVRDNAQALNWRLTQEEADAIDRASQVG